MVWWRVVNCPTRQSLLLFIGSLHWLSSWRWYPSIGGGKIVSATLEARNGRFDPFFLQISQIIYLQMENFVFAILYLVYFALKYMYFEDPWVKSREFPKMGMKMVFISLFETSWIWWEHCVLREEDDSPKYPKMRMKPISPLFRKFAHSPLYMNEDSPASVAAAGFQNPKNEDGIGFSFSFLKIHENHVNQTFFAA